MRWGTMTTKARATLVVAIAAVVWVGGVGSAGALVSAAVSNAPAAGPSATAEAQRFVQTPAPSRTTEPTRTPTAIPTPETVVTEVSERTDVPFARTTVEDATLPKDESHVTTAGVMGAKTTVYRVTTVDGVETKREQVREALNRAPVTEVTTVGTYVAPAPVTAPVPAQQAPAAPAPSTQQQGLITPGAFCADAQNGAVAQAANGRSYQCGGKGPDANGHLHWNTM
ncbi:G5 domain-containing protein [Curtobacterium sp. BH-2-1-1]|uniref:G5 domain-containing protein n=1 Tax=Curtobacterium sp. BH-2-1-1 TaxID=1905847 RepID=UPI0021565140|nr:G5 domain-containing protein [Curtobacterium sp. BH-2-1-1]